MSMSLRGPSKKFPGPGKVLLYRLLHEPGFMDFRNVLDKIDSHNVQIVAVIMKLNEKEPRW